MVYSENILFDRSLACLFGESKSNPNLCFNLMGSHPLNECIFLQPRIGCDAQWLIRGNDSINMSVYPIPAAGGGNRVYMQPSQT
jgi:hypothetical protein